MDILIKIIIAIVAALHLYFLYFEMFAWETTGRKVFKSLPKEIFKPTKSMAANQGLYNGFLAAGLIWTFFITNQEWYSNIAIFFLGCVAVAGVYAALTVSKKIFFIQAGPALVGIILLLIAN
ncbi:DUF1304 domain-containing protein [Olleya namhaensis]|uniref:Putative membrane protein n=1 Tax=Olleya namhaensis TaxID=1144750 RepID=A0A1I3RQM4_9FLAO|nr:DUF1304 domain-containing protein [Olleya namhaensis]SFJ48192.1 putative membrane protein [Olleya namhaensis]